MRLECGHKGCENCRRHAEYELIAMDGTKIDLCPQCALAIVFGQLEIMIVESEVPDEHGTSDRKPGPRYLN